LSANGPLFVGDANRIDVSGDTDGANRQTGLSPVHGAVLPGGTAYVANVLDNTISAVPASGTTTTIILPAGSSPVFLASTETNNVYEANYNYGTVGVINAQSSVLAASISLDPTLPNDPLVPNPLPKPVALVETPDTTKLYSVNQGTGSVTSINTVDYTRNPLITIGGSPVGGAARSDSEAVYVLDQASGNIFVIDPRTDVLNSGAVATAAGSDFILYDATLNRLYVSNSAADALWVYDASSTVPTLITGPITIPAPPASSSDPCLGSPVVPISMAALADGTRIYVGGYRISSNGVYICSQVSVFTTAAYALETTILLPANLPAGSSATAPPYVTIDTVDPTGCAAARPAAPGANGPAGFRLSVAASTDSSRVYAASCDAGNVSIITTSAIDFPGDVHAADSIVVTLPAPVSNFPATASTPYSPPSENPLFIFAPLVTPSASSTFAASVAR
jgi:DNA-binding beta-propeller fold protein YncE